MNNEGRYFENIFSGDYQLKDLADGILRTEDGCSFQIHKFELARSYKYFYALFCEIGKGKNDFMIPGVKGEDLSNILSFLYTGNIHVTEENILDLIVASDYLLLDDLLLRLKQHVRKNLNPSNSLPILKKSLEINQRDIFQVTYRYIQTHFENIIHCTDCQLSELPLGILKQLLSERNLRVKNETVVWWSVVNWVEADTVNRLCLVPELLLHLAVLDVDENMADSILEHKIVANNPYCKEIVDVKCHTSNGGLKTLQYYFQACSRPVMPLFEHRQPRHLYLICDRTVFKNHTDIYVTYDENVDLWRKITEVDTCPDFVLCVNNCVYLFDSNENQNLFYDVIDKQLNQVADFRTPRSFYKVVELGGRIYAFGGLSNDGNETRLYDGEYYNFETGDWHTTEPMIPLDNLTPVTLRNSIYVLGYQCIHGDDHVFEMIFQAYDPSSDTWNRLPSPTTIRRHSQMVVYRDMIYVVGGFTDGTDIKSVEVFDASTNTWNTESDLPYDYDPIRAVVINDKLIVYEKKCESRLPPVQWNFCEKRWELFEDFSVKNFCKCNFITVENECVGIFSRENKDPGAHFEYSPFV